MSMYTQIRNLILFVLVMLVFIIPIKKHQNTRKVKILLAVLGIILYTALNIYPVESLFIRFNTRGIF